MTPNMMSDEESIDSQTFERKRPSWRSEEFNAFIDMLDERHCGKYEQCARKVRVNGSPLIGSIPNSTPEWMICSQHPYDNTDI